MAAASSADGDSWVLRVRREPLLRGSDKAEVAKTGRLDSFSKTAANTVVASVPHGSTLLPLV